MQPRLGELLIQKNLITKKNLDLALEEQHLTKDFLGEILLRRGFVGEEDLMKALSDQFEIPHTSFRHQYIDWNVAMRFTPALVLEGQCLPIREDEHSVLVAIKNPLDAVWISRAEKEIRPKKLRLVLVAPAEMNEALKAYREQAAARQKRLFQ